MKKYDERNIDKQIVNSRKRIHAKSGQIRHCKLGINVGSEENGKGGFLRPVLVLCSIGNMLVVLPTTSKTNHKYPEYYQEIFGVDFGTDSNNEGIRSFAMLSQVRTISSERLIKHKFTVHKEHLNIIKKSLINFLI